MALKQKFRETKLFKALLVSLFLLAGLIFQPRFLFEPVRALFATIAWPIQGMFSSLAFSIQEQTNFLSSIGSLKLENEHLSRENVRLLAIEARSEVITQENNELRLELALLPREAFDLVASDVIGRDALGLGNWLTIDQGLQAGIRPGMPVIVYGGVLIGRITDVYPKSARVMLLTNPESAVSAVTVTGGAQGVLRGEYGLGLLLDTVLQDASLQPADRLVTSGLGGEFPKNLLIGTLQETHLSSDRLYRQASVAPPISFDTLRYVFIIKNAP